MKARLIATAASLAALAGAAVAAIRMAGASDLMVCLPPAVLQALS